MSANAVPQLLASTARELVTRIETSGACVISRVIGDLLVELTQHGRSGERYELGHEYLVSDFPLTAEVLARASRASSRSTTKTPTRPSRSSCAGSASSRC